MRNIYRYLLIVLLCGIAFCACSGDGERKPSVEPTITVPVTNAPTDKVEGPIFTKEKVLNWAVSESFRITDEQLREFNRMLVEDGCDFNVQFVGFSDEKYEGMVRKYAGAPLDVAYTGLEYANGSSSSYVLVKSGFFEPLDSYLAASEVYGLFSEVLWDAARVKGKVYSVPNLYAKRTSVKYVFNIEHFTKEEVEDITLSLEALEPYLKRAEGGDRFSPLLYEDSTHESSGREGIVFLKGMALSVAEDAFLDISTSEEVLSHFDTLHRFFGEGYIDYQIAVYDAQEDLSSGLKEVVEEQCQDVSFEELVKEGGFAVYITSDDVSATDFEYDVMIREKPTVMTGSTAMQMGIVATSENKEDAWRLLELYYTKPAYQKLLVMEDANATVLETEREALFDKYYTRCIFAGTECELRGAWQERKRTYDTNFIKTAVNSLQLEVKSYGETANGASVLWDCVRDIWIAPDYEERLATWQQMTTDMSIEEWVAEANAQLQEHLKESRNE